MFWVLCARLIDDAGRMRRTTVGSGEVCELAPREDGVESGLASGSRVGNEVVEAGRCLGPQCGPDALESTSRAECVRPAGRLGWETFRLHAGEYVRNGGGNLDAAGQYSDCCNICGPAQPKAARADPERCLIVAVAWKWPAEDALEEVLRLFVIAVEAFLRDHVA